MWFKSKSDGIELLEFYEVANAIVELVRSSEEWLLLVSPYFQPWRHLDDAIVDAVADGIDVDFLLRTDQLAKARKHFRMLGLQPRVLDKLHAKIYINERDALLTSMNLYDGSRESVEFGMWVNRSKQNELYEACRLQALKHFRKGRKCDIGIKKAASKTATKQKSLQSESDKPLKASEYKSYMMWRDNPNVAQIAEKRGIKESTVYSHLAAAIREGWIRVEDVVSASSRKALSAGLREVGPQAELSALVSASPKRVTYGEAACVLAALDVHRAIQKRPKANHQ